MASPLTALERRRHHIPIDYHRMAIDRGVAGSEQADPRACRAADPDHGRAGGVGAKVADEAIPHRMQPDRRAAVARLAELPTEVVSGWGFIRPSFEAVGLRGPTLEGGRGCICTLMPSSDWLAVLPW